MKFFSMGILLFVLCVLIEIKVNIWFMKKIEMFFNISKFFSVKMNSFM